MHTKITTADANAGSENLFGCVPGKMKAWWHMEAGKDANRFGQMLVETAGAINPDLTIVDGIIGHEGNGPSGGEPRQLNVLGAPAMFLPWIEQWSKSSMLRLIWCQRLRLNRG
jgi:uncharacterized protein (DUF362 family)